MFYLGILVGTLLLEHSASNNMPKTVVQILKLWNVLFVAYTVNEIKPIYYEVFGYACITLSGEAWNSKSILFNPINEGPY